MYKITVFLLLCIMLPLSVFAQNKVFNRTVCGKVVMKSAQEEALHDVEYANVALLLLPDSAFVAGTTSDDKGEFCLKANCDFSKKYLLRASFIGCASAYMEIAGKEKDVKAGTLTLQEDAETLREVVVTAVMQPVEQKGDTTVYNTEAYKIPDGAYLEALIRRIPGLSFDPKTKSIEYKGEKISEITVNGKEFFKGNTRVALENLPAHFVSRLKVYDKATEEEEMTGVKGPEKNYVLDLQTKKSVTGTLMAGIEGGYGTKNKYDAKGQAFNFKENGENLGIVGSFGNRNFTSLYDGNRAGHLSGNVSRKIGEDIHVSTNVGYNHTKTGNVSTSRNELYLTEQNQYSIAERTQENLQNSFYSSMNFLWNIDKKTMFHFTGGGNMSWSDNTSEAHTAKFNDNPGLGLLNPFQGFEQTDKRIRMNETLQNNSGASNNKGYNVYTSLIRKLSEEGSSLGISYSLYHTKQKNDVFKTSRTTFFQLQDVLGRDSVDWQHQYQDAPTRSVNHDLRLDYTWRFNKKNSLQLSYAFGLQQEKQSQQVYDLVGLTKEENVTDLPEGYESYRIDSLSNYRNSRTLKHAISLNYSYEGEVWKMYGGVTLTPQHRTLNQTDGSHVVDTLGNSVEWMPSLAVQYNKNGYDIGIRYNGNTRQPSLYDLMAPTVYHSSVYISRSNPNLKASYQHYLNFSFSNYAKGISAYIVCNQEFNGVTPATLYNPNTGGQETYPVNINGNWSVMGSSNYEKRLGSFKLAARTGGNYNHNVGLINENGGSELKESVTRASGINAFGEVSYLPSWGNIDLNGSWDFQQYKNQLSVLENSNTYTRTYTLGAVVSAQLPAHFQIDSDFAYCIRGGSYLDNDNENEALWNIKVTWKFGKERRAEVSAIWADILSQRKSLQRSATSNGFYESYAEQLRSYFMVSLRYKFNRMNN